MSPINRNFLTRIRAAFAAALISIFFCSASFAQSQPTAAHPTKIIIDSDIGDDVDDVFAIGLALTSPEVEILGISSAWGDTKLRARMIDRLLTETNATNISVAIARGVRAALKRLEPKQRRDAAKALWVEAMYAGPAVDSAA